MLKHTSKRFLQSVPVTFSLSLFFLFVSARGQNKTNYTTQSLKATFLKRRQTESESLVANVILDACIL